MIELLADIPFGQAGTSAAYVMEGWGPIEPGHRQSVGRGCWGKKRKVFFFEKKKQKTFDWLSRGRRKRTQ